MKIFYLINRLSIFYILLYSFSYIFYGLISNINPFIKYTILIILSAIVLVSSFKEELSYYHFHDKFQREIKIILGLFGFFLIFFQLDFLNKISESAFIYFVSSIIILRSLRIEETQSDNAERLNKKINYIILLSSIIISIEKLRIALLSFLVSIYNKTIEIFFYLFSWFFILLAKLLEKLFKGLRIKISSNGQEGVLQIKDVKRIIENKQNKSLFVFYKSMSVIFQILILLLFIYLIYKIFLRYYTSSKEYAKFKEEREFIKDNLSINKMFKRITKPYNKIRLYYQKYLIYINKFKQLKPSDTSFSIKQMADSLISPDINEFIRNVYIKERYGEEITNPEDKDKFIKTVKNIKKHVI
ncbi:MAG: hypothetical protein N2486_02315 [Caloramator sp.]|nr:hypothetical protein [Caloramator sp.]